MYNLLFSFFVSFIATYISVPVIIKIAGIKKLVDMPDFRKVHKEPIPSLGGLAIFAGFLLAVLIATPKHATENLQYYLAAAFIVYLLGLKDDILVISPMKKFLGQLLATFIIIYKGDVRIESMYGIMGIHELPYYFSVLLTCFVVIVIINAFNLIDGVDGLAGTLGIISALTFGIYFYYAQDIMYAILSFGLVGALAAFLIFNYTPAKIFMGDTGSMLIGLVNAILVLHFIKTSGAHSSVFPIASAPAIGFAILGIPLFDTLRLFTIRLLNRRSPFSPDRNHIHHIFLDCGFSHPMVTFIIAAINLMLIVFAFACRYWNVTNLLCTLVGISCLITASVFFSKRRRLLALARKTLNKTSPLHLETENMSRPFKVPFKRPVLVEEE